MNHIYKSIFNKALGVFTAVPEFASAHGKGSERTVVGRVAKGTAGFAASALAISIGLALTSTSAVAGPGIYINDGKSDDGCIAIPDASGPNVGIYGISNTGGGVGVAILAPGQVAPNKDYFAMNAMAPCLSSGNVAQAFDTQTNRTLFYGNDSYGNGTITNNGAKNLTLGGRLDVNSGIIGVGDRGVNGLDATNSIRMGMGTALSDANKQVDAITIGVNAGASAKHATAIGSATTAKTGYSTALGFQSQAGDPAVTNFNGEYATAIGGKAKALHAYTTALGAETNASGAYATAVGNEAKATHESTTAVGKGAKATNDFATAVGQLALASGKNGTAVGTRNEALGEEATALGYHSHANGSQQLSIGAHAGRNLDGSFSQSTHGISIGSLAGADNATAKSNDDSVLIGTESGRYAQGGNRNTSIGKSAGQYLNGNDNIAMGSNAGSGTATDKLEVSNTTAIGNNSKPLTDDSITIGRDSKAGKVDKFDGKKSIAIGTEATAMGTSSISMGYHAQSDNGHDSITIGTFAKSDNEKAMTIGSYSSASGAQSMVIANNYNSDNSFNSDKSTATARRAMVIGPESHATAEQALTIGDTNTVASARTYAIGNNINAAAGTNDSLAFGTRASVGGASSIALGSNTKTYTDDSISIGSFSESGGPATTGNLLGTKAIAIGYETKALATSAVALGYGATVENGHDSIAIGVKAKTSTQKSTTIGSYSEARGDQSTVIANNYDSKAGKAVSIASGARSQVYGAETTVSGNNSVAIGDTNTVTSNRTYAMGNNITTSAGAHDSLAFGTQAYVGNASAIAMGNTAKAVGKEQISIGKNAGADSANSEGNYYGVYIGSEAGRYQQGDGRNYAIGQNAGQYVKGSSNIALGTNAGKGEAGNVIDASSTIAIGRDTKASGYSGISIGTLAETTHANSIALGDRASATNGHDALAVGAFSKTTAAKAMSIGSYSTASGAQSIVIASNYADPAAPEASNRSTATAARAIVMGPESHATAEDALAIGNKNTVASARTYAIGNNINVAAGADDSLVFGTQAAVGAANTVAIGANANAAQANSVALGAGSATSAAHTGDYTLNTSYTAAGLPNAANGTVSVGSAGKERQIQNVAAGVISATSTDAINGSQLYATNNYLANFAGDVATKLGGNAALGNDGHLTMTNIGGTGKDNVNDAIAAANTKVAAGENITVTPTTNTDGSKTYTVATTKDLVVDSVKAGDTTVNTDGVTIANGPSITKSGINANGRKVTGVVDGDINATSTDAVNGSQLHATNTKLADVENTANTAVQEIESANPTALSVKKDGTKVTLTPNFIAGDLVDPTTGAVNTPAAGDEGKLVTAGTVAKALAETHFVVDTKATTDGELDGASQADQKIKSGNKVTLQAGKNLKAKQTNGTDGAQVEFSLKDSISLTQVTAGTGANQVVLGNDGVKVGGNTYINNDGLNANSKVISNVADGVKPTDAVNKGQLDAVKNVADSAVKSVDVANGEQNLLVDNTDPKNPKLSLKKDLTVDSVKAGDSTLNTDGLTIAGGPSVKKDGINAGDKKITGVADGNVAAGSTDAVNGGQLAEVKSKADSAVQNVVSANPTALTATKAGDTVTLTPNFIAGDLVNPTTGEVNTPAAGDEGKLVSAKAVADALKANHFVVDTKANGGKTEAGSEENAKVGSSNKVTFEAGKNLVAKQANTANGGATVKFSLQDDISLNSVTAGAGDNQVVLGNDGVKVGGKTYINNDGLNANDKKITNVAPGAVTPTSKDAVNGGQLYDVAKNVADLVGPDAKIDPATGKVSVADPAQGIGGTGKDNIGDAIKAVNATAAKHTTVVEGKNVKVTKGKNAAGGDEYTVATKDDLEVTSVTAGNTTVNTNGLTITGGPSVTRGGIDAGNRVISGVKAGDVSATSQEAVNGSQLHATNTKLDGVKAKADTAVQDVKSGDENALTAVKDPNTNIVTVTPKLSGDLVDADGNITAPATPADKGKLVTAGTVAQALANTHFVVDTKATDGELDASSQADQKIKAGNKVTLQAGKNLKAKQTNGANGAQVEFSLKDSISLTQVTAGDSTLNTDGLTIAGGPSVKKDGINAGDKTITNVAPGAVTAASKDAVNGGQLYNVANNVKDLIGPDAAIDPATGKVTVADPAKGIGETGKGTIGEAIKSVKDKADTAVQDIKSGDEKALSVTKAGNTYTITPNLSGDLVDANGNITAPATDADKGKLVTAGTVAQALANTHFVVDTKATDGELDGASQADQKIKAGNKVTLQAGKNLKAKQTNGANGAEVEFSLKDSISLTQVTAGDSTLNTDGLTIAGGPSVKKDGINAGDKKITNVAPGAVTPTSKDAVNGSQLYNVADNVKDLIGPDATIDPATGKVTVADPTQGIAGTGKGTIGEAIKSVKDKADTAVQDIKSGDEKALSVTKAGNTYTITPNLSGDLVDADGNITAPATDADKGKLVTAGTVAQALANTHFVVDTKATDGELDGASEADQKIKAGNKVTLQAGKNLKAKQTNGANGAQVEFSLKDSISLKEVTAGEGDNQVVLGNDGVKVGGNTYINKDGLNANNKVISNVADGVNPNDAVNKGQLDAVGKEAAKHTTVKAGKNVEVTEGTNAAGGKEYTVKTADNLDVTSVKAGDSTLNTDGLTIAGGPSVKKDGINAGDKKITNVAPGAVTPTSKDAVNGSQLYNVANNVKDLIGPDATIDPATGKVTVADPAKGIGETGKGNIGDAIKHVNDAAKAAADTAKKHTTVEQGDNILVEESLNADGGKHYKVSTARDLNVDSVKAGDTTVNNDGVTIAGGPSVTKGGINAGGNTITNVADGVNDTDAVNKGQLDKVAQNVVNVLGGNATVNGNGDITMSNIGDTGKGNVNDAIKAVNDLAKKAAAEKTSVKAKDGRSNVTVTEGVNAAGGHEYTVDVERAVTEAGSDQVTVTSKHDADSNTTTYTVDVSDKTKASLAKADSAVQGLTSKDGNLNFNKDPNGNVEVSFNDNLNVKNVTTDRVQVANGPSMTKDGINAAGKAISNVANGNVAADSKDAVNGGQLYDTAKSVADVIGGGATVKDGKVVAGQNGIGNTGQNTVHGAIAAINQNTANNFNQIRGDLRKMDRDLRGGIAGALATAGLPQAFRPGKSMVAAAASTYRGQSGLAIGVSRISDNGKIILKVTGNTNSRGDFGGTIGAGYQW